MKNTITIGQGTTHPLKVNRLGFGAMRLASVFGKPAPAKEDALAILRETSERGINFIDTADFYGRNLANELISEALHPYKQDLVICTKIGAARTDDDKIAAFARPDELRKSVENNLRTLRLDQLALVHFRVMDDEGFERSMQSMFDLQREGKILHVGVSNVTKTQLEQAVKIGQVATVENMYGHAQRGSMKTTYGEVRGAEDILPVCEAHGIPLIPFFSLHTSNAKKDDRMAEVAKKYGLTEAQMNVAWLMNRSAWILPIPGTSSLKHLQENIEAASIEIDPEDMEYLS